MSIQKIVLGLSCLLFLCSGALANAVPVTDQAAPATETETELGPLTTTEESREGNVVFDVWAYAKVHDGSVNVRSSDPEPAQQQDSRGNQCLWAIVACCDASQGYARENCFETLGCPGAWFQNLCSEEFIHAANSQVTDFFGFNK